MKRTPLKRRTPLRARQSLTKAPGSALKRTRLSPASPRHKERLKLYAKQRKAFLAIHGTCMICSKRRSTDIHHSMGRGKYLLDQGTWIAACRPCHQRVHRNPSWARAHGWLV